MKIFTLIIVSFLIASVSMQAKIWKIGNSSNKFTPNTITITYGDTVNFSITSIHDAREVSEATWNSNKSSALTGGFQTKFGGGTVLPEKLSVGTHYYVCTPHASVGMKGIIIVENKNTDVIDMNIENHIKIYPNPANEYIEINLTSDLIGKEFYIADQNGNVVYIDRLNSEIVKIDLTILSSGIYFIKFGNSITKAFVIAKE